MTQHVDDAHTFAQLVQRIDPATRLLRAWPLTGGVSAQVTGLETERADGTTEKLVVRLHGPRDIASNPNIARDEYRLLQITESHGIAAPRPVFLDESCELFPTPIVVIEFVEGETILDTNDADGYVTQMAAQLAVIHRVEDSPELSFLPRIVKGFGERPETLDDALNEGRIRDALESAGGLARSNGSVLLHNDYWPGNLLWNDDRLVAVIDWEDASVGDPLVDLGNSRLEMLFFFGAEAMRTFTGCYLSLTLIDTSNLAYWDLCAALRPCSRMSEWGLDAADEARMREQHAWFVTQAIAALTLQ